MHKLAPSQGGFLVVYYLHMTNKNVAPRVGGGVVVSPNPTRVREVIDPKTGRVIEVKK